MGESTIAPTTLEKLASAISRREDPGPEFSSALLSAHEAQLLADQVKALVDVLHDAEGTTDPNLEVRQAAALTLLLEAARRLQELTSEIVTDLRAAKAVA
jgi:hypothetical protein